MRSASLRRELLFLVVLLANSWVMAGNARSAEDQAKLYFFTNAGCAPCKIVEPEIEQLYREGFSVMKIDTTLHPDWTQRFKIQKTPTVVLVSKNQVVAQHSGYIDAATMRAWFRSVESSRSVSAVTQSRNARTSATSSPNRSTVHKGTYQPANQIEKRALQATVKLKIDDPLGTSFATGTVIHSVNGESLVLTCGHVFRDSNGKGKITAEYGFADNDIRIAQGELLYFDSDARDVGLVAISTSENIQPVALANADFPVQKEMPIFTLGCDQGDRPSIRRSKIKNTAKYDYIVKHEIYGRPVNGRSGGGLFTADGKLIGVCNAAVVDADEGVYVALDTIHWQNKQVNLAHLFDKSSKPNRPNVVQNHNPVSPRLAQVDSSVIRKQEFDSIPVRDPLRDSRRGPLLNANVASAVSSSAGSSMELIVVLRDRNAAGNSESWAISNPSEDLVRALKEQRRLTSDSTQSDRIAQLRGAMPNLQQASGKNYNSATLRAQSPR